MFADAIEKVSGYTRPIKFIMRNYGSVDIITGSSTLFFVNENGVAITCKHIADELLKCGTINAKYAQYKAELSKSALKAAKKEALARKYGYDPSVTVQYNSMFVDCADVKGGSLSFTVRSHPKYDLAVIILQNAVKYQYSGHAVFAADTSKLRTGDFLCRYGYPFCEFTDYKYDERKDELSWVKSGKVDTPAFPTEGMFTRNVADESGRIYMYELSTPGLLGQSGGPLFDKSGTVYGMQAQTAYLHMGFDQYEAEVVIDGQKRKVEDHPFLHVGRCITADIIKEFLKSSGIKYYVGDPGGKVRTVNG